MKKVISKYAIAGNALIDRRSHIFCKIDCSLIASQRIKNSEKQLFISLNVNRWDIWTIWLSFSNWEVSQKSIGAAAVFGWGRETVIQILLPRR